MSRPTITTPAELLRIVVEQNGPMEKIEKFLDLQDRWEATQARKAFNGAMAKFREAQVKVLRSKEVEQGPLRGTAYAKLSDFVAAAAPALASAGLSVSWRIVEDEKDWLKVACIVRHIDGHQEETAMGGPPDVGGAKNAIQARASTVSYLEKYTLKMALGLAEQDDDDDGNGGGPSQDYGRRSEPDQRRAEPQQPAQKPAYPDAKFDENHDSWLAAIESGKKTPEAIVAMVETRFCLSEDQKRRIHKLGKTEAAQ